MQTQPKNKQLWLLLAVKSLTIDHSPKTYQLIVENSNINNSFNISQSFQHNYEYVYQLWPCKPTERQLLKVQLFEVSKDGSDLMKKGEASPLVRYSRQGDRFQFRGEDGQKQCLVIMKFKVAEYSHQEDRIEDEFVRNSEQFNSKQSVNYNESSIPRVQTIQSGSSREPSSFHVSNSRYLSMTPRESQISQLKKQQKGPHSRLKTEPEPTTFKYEVVKGPHSRLKTEPEPTTFKYEVVSTPRNIAQRLSKSKYLQHSLPVSASKERAALSQLNLVKEEERSRWPQKEEKKAKTEVEYQNKTKPDIGDTIKRRRQEYLKGKSEVYISKRPSLSPLPSQFTSPRPYPIIEPLQKQHQQLKKQEFIPSVQNNLQKSQVRIIEPIAHKVECDQIDQLQEEYRINQTLINQLTSSGDKKEKQQSGEKQETSKKQQQKEDQIVRVSNHPRTPLDQEATSPALADRMGTIRINKHPTSRPNPLIQFTQSRQSSSAWIANSRYRSPLASKIRTFDLNFSHFSATSHSTNPHIRKRLLILFEDKRYSTDIIPFRQNQAIWQEKVGLRNCKQTGYIYLRVYNFREDGLEVEQGEACISIGELVRNKKDRCRAYMLADQKNVGIIEFQVQKIQIMGSQASRGRKSSDNSFSLPQIKRQSLPKGCRNRTKSISTSEPCRPHPKLSKGPAGHKSKTKLPTFAHTPPVASRLCQQIKQSGAVKIRHQKMKLKLKNK